jgi:hypothetical protein
MPLTISQSGHHEAAFRAESPNACPDDPNSLPENRARDLFDFAPNSEEVSRRPDMTDTPAVKEKSLSMPSSCRQTYHRAMSGRSPAAGIRSFGLECTAWQREEVKLCTSQGCPLFPYRPFKD